MMNQYILIAAIGLTGPLLYIISLVLYKNSKNNSINWPGNDKWTEGIRSAVNLSFKRHATIILMGNLIGIALGMTVYAQGFCSYRASSILTLSICMSSTITGLGIFIFRVPKIVGNNKIT